MATQEVATDGHRVVEVEPHHQFSYTSTVEAGRLSTEGHGAQTAQPADNCTNEGEGGARKGGRRGLNKGQETTAPKVLSITT